MQVWETKFYKTVIVCINMDVSCLVTGLLTPHLFQYSDLNVCSYMHIHIYANVMYVSRIPMIELSGENECEWKNDTKTWF